MTPDREAAAVFLRYEPPPPSRGRIWNLPGAGVRLASTQSCARPAYFVRLGVRLGCVMRGDGDGILDDVAAYWMPALHGWEESCDVDCCEREMSRGERGR